MLPIPAPTLTLLFLEDSEGALPPHHLFLSLKKLAPLLFWDVLELRRLKVIECLLEVTEPRLSNICPAPS